MTTCSNVFIFQYIVGLSHFDAIEKSIKIPLSHGFMSQPILYLPATISMNSSHTRWKSILKFWNSESVQSSV